MNFQEFKKKFPSKKAIILHFANIRHQNGIKCQHCGNGKVYHRKDSPKLFECRVCNNSFSIFKDTIFEKSRTDLKKWFYAIHLFLNGKKGISALQLQRETGTTYKTAWRMLKQIRKAMGNDKDDDDDDFMNTVIEMDETYIGGKATNKHMSERVAAKGKFKKETVLGMLERNKKLRAFVLENGARRDDIFSKILENIKDGSKIITDEHKAYYLLYTRFNHKVVNHSQGQYVNGKGNHTNTIEGFWATLKRGVYGIYHHVSKQHLQKYVDEFAFRYNNRGNEGMFDLVLKQSVL